MSPLGSLYTITMLRSWSSALMSYMMSSPKRCFCYGSSLPGAMMISLAWRAGTGAILSVEVFGLVLFLRMSAYEVLTSTGLSASPRTILVRPSSWVLIVRMSSVLSHCRDPNFGVRAASLTRSHAFYSLGGQFISYINDSTVWITS